MRKSPHTKKVDIPGEFQGMWCVLFFFRQGVRGSEEGATTTSQKLQLLGAWMDARDLKMFKTKCEIQSSQQKDFGA